MREGGYKIRNQHGIYFISFAVVQWVDVFTRKCYQDIAVDSLRNCQKNKGLILHAWVIMSNHMHLIASVQKDSRLSDILRDFKKFTSVQILRSIENNQRESRREWMLKIFKDACKQNSRNENFQFWRQDNHPVELVTNRMKNQRLHYLHLNPVKAGIVKRPEDYVYSSARNYCSKIGLLEIVILE
ncbi:MAG: putative transposase [Bacteroidia bacterium]|jgi:putative transposase